MNYFAIKPDATEQQIAEGAQGFLAAIVENSGDAIAACTPAGVILTWNHRAERMFGYASQEIIGRNTGILDPPDCDGDFLQFIEDIRSERPVAPFDTVLEGKDGRRIDVSLLRAPIRSPAGEVIGVSWTARYIGEGLRTEKNREGEKLSRQTFEHAPFGMCDVGLNGRLIRVNSTLCRMFGYSEAALLNTSWADLTQPQDREASQRVTEQLLKDPIGCVEIENRFLHYSGTEVWGRTRISLAAEGESKTRYFRVRVEDITERKIAKEALHESENRFRILADACPTMMWATNAQGEVEFINRKYREFSGATIEQVEGSKWRLMVHPHDAAEYIGAFRRAVEEHTSFRADARVQRFDGEWRWFGTYAEPYVSPVGAYLGHVGVSADITERRQAEQALDDAKQFAQSTIDALSSHVCVLNETGTVIATN